MSGGACILYSHWEGFVRDGANLLLEHIRVWVDSQDDLIISLRAAILLEYVERNQSIWGIDACAAYLQRSDTERFELLSVPRVGKIAGNLSFEVFSNLINVFGIDVPEKIKVKRQFINVALLERRNQIAHGQGVILGLPEFTQAKDQVIELLDVAQELFVECVLSDGFLRR